MRAIGLDIHRGFCEVAIAEDGVVRPARRIGTAPDERESFAASLRPDDQITLEATGNAMAIVRILEPHARVVLANPKATKAATRLRAKTDRIDARTLAQLLASGFLPDVWQPDPRAAALRTKAKNQVHAALIRNLVGRPPASDLFGRRGRAWLAGVELPARMASTVHDQLGTSPTPCRIPNPWNSTGLSRSTAATDLSIRHESRTGHASFHRRFGRLFAPRRHQTEPHHNSCAPVGASVVPPSRPSSREAGARSPTSPHGGRSADTDVPPLHGNNASGHEPSELRSLRCMSKVKTWLLGNERRRRGSGSVSVTICAACPFAFRAQFVLWS
jgi:hypothetical protein